MITMRMNCRKKCKSIEFTEHNGGRAVAYEAQNEDEDNVVTETRATSEQR